MDSYRHPTTANDHMNRSPNWFEANNSEFFYEQSQIKNVNSFQDTMFEESIQQKLPRIQPEQLPENFNFQRPISMHFNNEYPSRVTYMGEDNSISSYAPCQGPRPWNFAQCYGFYGQPACPLVNIIDMEDFM